MAEGDFELAKKLCQELGIAIPEPEHFTDDGNAARKRVRRKPIRSRRWSSRQ